MSSTVTVTPTVTDDIQRARISSRTGIDFEQVYGRKVDVVVFDGCPVGLGIKIIGGAGEEGERDFGVFIKRIFFGGLVATDGRLQEGDEILEVNGDTLSGVTNKEAVQLLRQAAASDFIKLIVTRDEKARGEFLDCLDSQSESCGSSSLADQASVSSQSSPRSTQGDRTWSPRDQLSPRDAASPQPQLSPLSAHGSHHGTPPSGASLHHDTPPSDQGSHQGIPRNTSPLMTNAGTFQIVQTRFRTPGELTYEDSDRETETGDWSHSACSSPGPPAVHPTPLPAYGTPQPKVSNTTAAALGLPRGPLLAAGPALTGGLPVLTKTSTPHAACVNPPGSTTPLTTDGASRDLSGISPFLQTSPLSDCVFEDDDDAMTSSAALDPQSRIRVEKLEVALRYLGIEPTSKQQQELRNAVHVDSTGYVAYGDFVRVTRRMFRQQLAGRNLGPSHPFRAGHVSVTPAAGKLHDQPGDLSVLLQEREQLTRDLDRLQIALREKEKACSMAEEELLRVRKEAQGAVQEARALRSKVHLAEQAQRAAQSMEHDYEEVVRLLEAEMIELKGRDSKVMDHPEVQKRLAVLTCQLRKSDLSKKTYEVATEKLLQFTEAVHEVLTGQGDGVGLRADAGKGEPSRGGRPPHYLGKHKRHTPLSIAAEAREVVKAVKSLIDVEPLPYGWDEAYTEDGVKYYINHLTQVTSWNHPLSNVEHTSSRPGSSQGRPLPPMPPLQNYDTPDSRA